MQSGNETRGEGLVMFSCFFGLCMYTLLRTDNYFVLVPRKVGSECQQNLSSLVGSECQQNLSSLVGSVNNNNCKVIISLVPRPRGRREKWPGIHCLRMREKTHDFMGYRIPSFTNR